MYLLRVLLARVRPYYFNLLLLISILNFQSIYKKIVLKDQKIIGAVMYGDTLDGPFFQELMDNKIDIQHIRPQLMFGRALCESLLADLEQYAKGEAA